MEKFIAEEEFLLHFWHCPKALKQGNAHVSGLANFGPIEQKLLNLE